jgi:predicted RNA-binding Zn-ribbon protein involved in translation (DUF1610 family)
MGKELLVLELHCPNCKAILTEGTKVVLQGYSTKGKEKGEIRLSAVFGDYAAETELNLSDGEIVEFQCPHCEASLMIATKCKECNASMASLNIKEGGTLDFCPRKGCHNHVMGGFKDVDEMMRIMNNVMDTPFQ